MKLYYSPGACSLAPHIVAREADVQLALEKVDTRSKRTIDGRDFHAVTAKGYVPALELADGEVITEGPVISQYLVEQAGNDTLLPPAGSIARYRVLSMLGYINSELHKSYSPLFNPASGEELRSERKAYLARRYALVEQQLDPGPYLFGDTFTIADAYLFVVTSWARPVGVDLSAFPRLRAFQRRVVERPAVQAALAAEGLGKASRAA